MKILIFINFIIFVIVCSDIDLDNNSLISEKCYNNLNFNFTINKTDDNSIIGVCTIIFEVGRSLDLMKGRLKKSTLFCYIFNI